MNSASFRLPGLVALAFGAAMTLSGRPAVDAPANSPLIIEQTVAPQFPNALAFSPISDGTANIVISVNADGKLVDLLIASYTNRAFADEAVDVLRRWSYTAARENGEPIGLRTMLRFDFRATGRVVSLTAIDTIQLIEATQTHPLTRVICQPAELDRLPAALAPVAPANPAHRLAARAPRNSVVVDFYIDDKGVPRMPVVVESPHDVFSQAAVGALTQWRFTAPTRGGKPVAVRVRQEFIFPGSS